MRQGHLASNSMRTQFTKAKWWGNLPEQGNNIHMLNEALGVWVILRPKVNKLPEMVGPKDGPVPCEVVEVVHDDGNEEVEHKEGAHHEEADEEWIGHIGAATLWLASVIRHRVTNSPLTGMKKIIDTGI